MVMAHCLMISWTLISSGKLGLPTTGGIFSTGKPAVISSTVRMGKDEAETMVHVVLTVSVVAAVGSVRRSDVLQGVCEELVSSVKRLGDVPAEANGE